MAKKQKRKKNYPKIIANQVEKLLILEGQKKTIIDSQRKIIDKITAESNGFCDDRDIKEQAAKNEEVAEILQNVKASLSRLRTLV